MLETVCQLFMEQAAINQYEDEDLHPLRSMANWLG
jgi:hypothetical protein